MSLNVVCVLLFKTFLPLVVQMNDKMSLLLVALSYAPTHAPFSLTFLHLSLT